MKINLYCTLIAAILISGPGCRKEPLSDSVSLSSKTKAGQGGGFPTFPMNQVSDRLLAFDNGSGLNCIIGYDVVGNIVQLLQDEPPNTQIGQLWQTNGLIVDGVQYNINTVTPSDEFNEEGGWHLAAFDESDDGRMDHLVAWCAGTGQAMVLQNEGGGNWHALYNSYNSRAGIGGYDLHGTFDKILPYDMGNGHQDCLICYRPGNQFFWVLQNHGSISAPNYVAVVKSNGGVGGYDLKDTVDQIAAAYMGSTPASASENLVCYRPGYGFVWVLSHSPNTTSWTAINTSRSGVPLGLSFMERQDRMMGYDGSGSGFPNVFFCWRPGTVGSAICLVGATGGWGGAIMTGAVNASPVLLDNPYGSPITYIGDKFIAINDNNGFGNSTLIDYEAGQAFNNLWMLDDYQAGLYDYYLEYP